MKEEKDPPADLPAGQADGEKTADAKSLPAGRQGSGVSKSETAQREEETLAFWNENKIFEKTLEKTNGGESFVFYDGPPFATGLPHYGHLLAGSIKDAIPRYQTMKGKHVRRKWGWDCHGLPIENLIEEELKLENKQDIEKYGIEKFNEAARASVLRYDADWKEIVPKMGRFIDMEDSYKTMDWQYSESIWWAFKTLYDKNLIYKGYKSMHVCPRCETTLSNNEVAEGYKDIKDISVTAKFELIDEPDEKSSQGEQAKTYVLAWTTTPWTLPGNVALAVGEDIEYIKSKIKNQKSKVEHFIIVAKELAEKVLEGFEYEIVEEFKGKDLIGRSYKPLFDYYAKDKTLENRENGWKIYGADFVTTEDGTGVVHIAPAFGEDDMNLGKEYNLPFVQHVAMNGKFKDEVTDFAGLLVKPKDDPNSATQNGQGHMSTDIEIIKYLAHKDLLFAKQKIEHSYPHCWRCHTPLLNYAADSWFVKVIDLRDKLVKENKKVKWIPETIGTGRFGNWLEGARDWAISRSRYWGAPFPVWTCDSCDTIDTVGSIEELSEKLPKSGNLYTMMRHGQSEGNVGEYIDNDPLNNDGLTNDGKKQVKEAAEKLKKEKFDIIISSDLVRTKETAEISAEVIGFDKKDIVYDERIREVQTGDLNKKPVAEYHGYFKNALEKFEKRAPNGENLIEMKDRVMEFLHETDKKYKNKKILIVTHEYVTWLLTAGTKGLCAEDAVRIKNEAEREHFLENAETRKLDLIPLPHNRHYETDLHRPYIDEITYPCSCGGKMKRIPDVFDCWFESGSMPYAQLHYPFENKKEFKDNFPADFIAEGLDQTRGWFYSLLVLSVGLFGETPYKNVIVNGMALAEDGQKMSKSLKNYPDPMYVVDKYSADALRYYLLASPIVRAETLNFSEKGVGEVSRKVIARTLNVLSFYQMYADRKKNEVEPQDSKNVLDIWILERLEETLGKISDGFDSYQMDKATRPIGDFVDDLSTWYVRRSRARFKGDDVEDRDFALATTRYVLEEFSKMIAPTMPFVAEHLYKSVEGKEESVHLEDWLEPEKADEKILEEMVEVRNTVSLALEARATAGIKVRQPLASLKVKSEILKGNDELLKLIADEVNVKEVVVDMDLEGNTYLNTDLTPELIQEGQFRELIRNVQSLRKKTELTPDDIVTASIKTDAEGKKLVEKFKEELMKTTLLKKIVFDDVDLPTGEGEEFFVDKMNFVVFLEK